VDLKDIDPIYYERTYWLAPDGEAAERPWRLLTSAMEAEGKAGIGTVVMRNKQYLGAIRPLDGALALSTMRFADEVVPQADVDALPGRGSEPEAKELRLATQIIDSLATEWDPERYHDTYTEELRELIDAKAKGEEVVAEEEAPGTPKVIDLMQALEASLAAARKGGGRSLATEVAKVAEQLADDAAADGGGDDAGGRSGGSGRKEAASAGNRPAKAGRSSAKAGRSSAKAGRSSAKATGGEATGRNAAGHKAAGRKDAGQKAAGRKAADSGSPSAPSGRSGAAGKKSA
jgi:DNA end-binding protein Ku